MFARTLSPLCDCEKCNNSYSLTSCSPVCRIVSQPFISEGNHPACNANPGVVMNANNVQRSFVAQFVAIVMIMTLVLTALPIQTAHAAVLGFSAPTAYSKSALTNPGNAYISDNQYVTSNGNNKSAEYGNFGLSIPAGATINLIEVSVEGHGTKNWKVAVSRNNGASYSGYTNITNANTNSDATTVTICSA